MTHITEADKRTYEHAAYPVSAHTLNSEKFWQYNVSIKGISITPIGLLGQPSANTIRVSDMRRMTEANRTRDPISGSVWVVLQVQTTPVLSGTSSRILSTSYGGRERGDSGQPYLNLIPEPTSLSAQGVQTLSSDTTLSRPRIPSTRNPRE